MADKAALRRGLREARAQWSAAERSAGAQQMRAVAPQLAALSGSSIAGFQPTNGEPDVGPLLTDLMSSHGLTVLIPRTAPGRRLEWVQADRAALTGERSGIPRPSGAVVAFGGHVADRVGVILVPALAVDPRTGARLGYGAGYYDRLLADLTVPVRIVGVCRRSELVELPVDDHDLPVDSVLTGALASIPAGDDPRAGGSA